MVWRSEEVVLLRKLLTGGCAMCPLCIGTALVLWGSTGSAGGLAAVTLKSIKKHRTSLLRQGECEEKQSQQDKQDDRARNFDGAVSQWRSRPRSTQ
jgi:hypothetical protein